ncbi:MAG: alpha,alpha-trehalose-phosphate synthase (UDP-forming) [Egibacteraceae bacterium]
MARDEESGLVVASNRGPVSWREVDGELEPTRGAGGLIVALGGALQTEEGTWVSVAMDEAETKVAEQHPQEPFDVDTGEGTFRVRLLDVGERFDAYYNRIANRLLWFTVHELWGAPYEPRGAGWRGDWYYGYESVNERVARAVVEQAEGGREIYLQDYHLCAAARTVRQHAPDARILHYIHTPWVGPGHWRTQPTPIAEGIMRGLLAADVVAFSSPLWSLAFRRCAEELLGATVSGESVLLDDRRTVVADFTLGVDEEQLQAVAASDEAAEAAEWIEDRLAGRRLLVRADRTDLSKNILRGLEAYELLLERHPEHRGQIWHLVLLQPSRQDVPEYRDYYQACMDVVTRIQESYGEDVVTVLDDGDYPRVVAALSRSDVLLTNPVLDGTNLVAKEGPVLNRHDGVLVLSRNAGAVTVLGEAALVVNPYDVEEQADALDQALTMSRDERATRAEALREAARLGAHEEWFSAQRHLLRATVARRR